MSKDAGPQPSLEHLAWDAIWTLLPHMDPPEGGHTLRANKLLKELCDSSVCWEALHCSNTWVTPRPCDLPPKSALVKRWASEVRLRHTEAEEGGVRDLGLPSRVPHRPLLPFGHG